MAQRFATLTDEEIERKREEAKNQNTVVATKKSVKILMDFMTERDLLQGRSLLEFSEAELDEILQRFYFALRQKNGEQYCNSSLKGIQYGLRRYFYENGKDYDIVNGSAFSKSRSDFTTVKKDNKKQGRGFIKHHPEISEEGKIILCVYHTVSAQ